MAEKSLTPLERIERKILLIRGEKVIIDTDLAELYGVSTKRLKEQVRRNEDRFPPDFAFELTAGEKAEVVANCDHLKTLRFSPYLPLAFTEHGALMAANVLNSPRAVRASLQIIRTFVRLREMVSSNASLARKLEALEKKYNRQFKAVFDAIRELLEPPHEPKRQIGFRVEEAKTKDHSRSKTN